MKETVVFDGPRAEIIESSIPKAEFNKVVIKVEVSGTNPKDWKTWWAPQLPINMGDDFAGTIHEVGPGVSGFRPGDRVFAFHEIQKPHGSYAEYALAWAYTTCGLATDITYEEASTIPLAALTASLALYSILGLPPPWSPTETENPVLIYGGSSAVGAFAIKLARISNLHPIITVAGAGGNYVSSLLDASKGDVLIDYRRGPEAVKSEIQTNLLGRRKLEFAFDAISEKGSSKICAAVLTEGGKLAHTLPLEAGVELSEHTTASLVMSGDIHGSFGEHQEQREFGSKMMRLFGRGLEEGWFSGHPYEVVPGGLDAVERILQDLKAEKASAKKFVFRISDTEGLEGRASMASFT